MNRREILIEAATTAWRPRSPSGEIRPHSAWGDLDAAGSIGAYEATRQLRRLEAALDDEVSPPPAGPCWPGFGELAGTRRRRETGAVTRIEQLA